eukprot:COSAG02_NODE_663_length_18741_cov_9.083682_11_plen_174_part_00
MILRVFDQHGRSPESPAGWRDGGRWRIESLIVTNNAQNAKHHHHNTSLSFTMGKGFGDGGKSGGKGKAGEPKKPVTRSARAGLQVRGGWFCVVSIGFGMSSARLGSKGRGTLLLAGVAAAGPTPHSLATLRAPHTRPPRRALCLGRARRHIFIAACPRRGSIAGFFLSASATG